MKPASLFVCALAALATSCSAESPGDSEPDETRVDALSTSYVGASPSCGPSSGFGVTLHASGFAPHSSVSWRFRRAGSKQKLLSGYFATDAQGAFDETTFIEDVGTGKFELIAYDDDDVDGKRDDGGEFAKTKIRIPCSD